MGARHTPPVHYDALNRETAAAWVNSSGSVFRTIDANY
jgi:hypothetical protein